MEDHSLEVTRVIKAPIDHVWKAWTDPAEMKQWLAPESLTTPDVETDLKVGGAYRIVMKGADGEHVAVGTFTTVDAPRTLGFSWKWEGTEEDTQVTVELEEVADDQTKVTLRHSGFANAKGAEFHTQGWESTFNKLEKHIA